MLHCNRISCGFDELVCRMPMRGDDEFNFFHIFFFSTHSKCMRLTIDNRLNRDLVSKKDFVSSKSRHHSLSYAFRNPLFTQIHFNILSIMAIIAYFCFCFDVVFQVPHSTIFTISRFDGKTNFDTLFQFGSNFSLLSFRCGSIERKSQTAKIKY